MPEYYESTLGLLGIIPYIIFLFIALIVSATWGAYSEKFSLAVFQGAGIFIACFGALAIVLNAVIYLFSLGYSESPYMRAGQFAESQGLKSGTAYPVVLGDRVAGSSGSAYVYGGIFTSSASVDIQPGSAVSMGFQSGNSSYIFEIPMSQVTFKQSDDNESYVTFYLGDDTGSSFGDSTVKKTNCRNAVASVVLVRRCDFVPTYHPYEDSLRRGLAPVVAGFLDSATIELSPELYQDVLGQP